MKHSLKAEKKAHQNRAAKFYTYLKETPNIAAENDATKSKRLETERLASFKRQDNRYIAYHKAHPTPNSQGPAHEYLSFIKDIY